MQFEHLARAADFNSYCLVYPISVFLALNQLVKAEKMKILIIIPFIAVISNNGLCVCGRGILPARTSIMEVAEEICSHCASALTYASLRHTQVTADPQASVTRYCETLPRRKMREPGKV